MWPPCKRFRFYPVQTIPDLYKSSCANAMQSTIPQIASLALSSLATSDNSNCACAEQAIYCTFGPLSLFLLKRCCPNRPHGWHQRVAINSNWWIMRSCIAVLPCQPDSRASLYGSVAKWPRLQSWLVCRPHEDVEAFGPLTPEDWSTATTLLQLPIPVRQAPGDTCEMILQVACRSKVIKAISKRPGLAAAVP